MTVTEHLEIVVRSLLIVSESIQNSVVLDKYFVI